jgi:mannose-1-phosphate guanylyltransferase
MFWNTGIIFGNAQKILKEIQFFQGDIFNICQTILNNNFENFADLYSNCPTLSFDKAILEKTKNATTITVDCGWSDISKNSKNVL